MDQQVEQSVTAKQNWILSSKALSSSRGLSWARGPVGWVQALETVGARGKFQTRSGKWSIFNANDLRIMLTLRNLSWLYFRGGLEMSTSIHNNFSEAMLCLFLVLVLSLSLFLCLCVCMVCVCVFQSFSLFLSLHTHKHIQTHTQAYTYMMIYLSIICAFPENLPYFSQMHYWLYNCFNCISVFWTWSLP